MVKIFTSEALAVCNDQWLLSFGPKSYKYKDDQNEECHCVQGGKGCQKLA
jgi:hypothetical protein